MSSQGISFFANFNSVRLLRWIFFLTVLGAFTAPDAADARMGRGGYDGIWSVLIISQVGNCDPTYRYPFQISGGRVSSASAATVSGSVGRGGSIIVRISAGGSVATGSGRLGGNTGAGRWRARLSGGDCSGRWQATRG